jgi:hypothetical protein
VTIGKAYVAYRESLDFNMLDESFYDEVIERSDAPDRLLTFDGNFPSDE